MLPTLQYELAFGGGSYSGWVTHYGLFGRRVLTVYPNDENAPTIQLTSRLFNDEYIGYFSSGNMGWLPGGRYFAIVQEPYSDERILILDAGEPANTLEDKQK